MNFLFYLGLTILTVIFMELIAIFTHKYIMHGPGWFLHKSHHLNIIHKKGNFELNDVYFIFFSLPSIICIVYGFLYSNLIFLSMGFGVLIYGIIYIVFHDIIVHNRFNLKIKSNNKYVKKMKSAHIKHHSCKNKKGASNFGFLTY